MFLSTALVVLLSCAAPTAPTHPDDTYPSGLFFCSESEAMCEDASTPPTIRVRPGRLVVVGFARSPNSCYQIGTGEWSSIGSEVVISVTVSASGADACLTVISGVAYRASIDLTPGTYAVRLRHQLLPPTALEFYVLATDTVVVIP
jgi:hypothetical protein